MVFVSPGMQIKFKLRSCNLLSFFLLTLFVLFVFLGCNPNSDEIKQVDTVTYEYEVIEGKAFITSVSGDWGGEDVNLVVPAEIDGYSVGGLAEYAFKYCYGLDTVSLPEGLLEIEDRAFFSCSLLRTVNIPSTVHPFTACAFWNCEDMENVNVEESSIFLTSVDGVLYSNDLTSIIYFPPGRSDTSYEINENVHTIGEAAFKLCENLEEVVIPDGLEGIKLHAFSYCISLANIEFPNTLIEIGGSAFMYCNSLISVYIPDSVTILSWAAFDGCELLESVRLPDNLEIIDVFTFQNCVSLSQITIPDSVTRIDAGAFYDCESLEQFIIPEKVSSLSCFRGCTSIEEFIVDEGNLAYSALDGVLYNKSITVLESYPLGKEQSTFIIPDTVSEINTSAFEGSANLTSVILPDSLNKIQHSAFRDCSSLTEINLPESVWFLNCYAFYGCLNMERVEVYRAEPASIGINVFANQKEGREIFVPADSLDDYLNHGTWSEYANAIRVF